MRLICDVISKFGLCGSASCLLSATADFFSFVLALEKASQFINKLNRHATTKCFQVFS